MLLKTTYYFSLKDCLKILVHVKINVSSLIRILSK